MIWISLGLVETHIRPNDTDGLLNSLTPANYNFIPNPRCTGLGGGVGFLCRKTFSPSIVSSPVFRSFEIIILFLKSDYNSSVAACGYRPPGSCTTQFLEDFLALSGFLSSPGSKLIICGDISVHLDVECGDRSRFNDILQCCGLVQSVSGPTHILGHTLDVLITPCDSDFVHNVSDGDFHIWPCWPCTNHSWTGQGSASKQIAWCNRLANKDRGSYYTNLIIANSDDPKKLWQSLRKVLHHTSETVLPAHSSDTSLVDMFASFFSNKISKMRDKFYTSGASCCQATNITHQ